MYKIQIELYTIPMVPMARVVFDSIKLFVVSLETFIKMGNARIIYYIAAIFMVYLHMYDFILVSARSV